MLRAASVGQLLFELDACRDGEFELVGDCQDVTFVEGDVVGIMVLSFCCIIQFIVKGTNFIPRRFQYYQTVSTFIVRVKIILAYRNILSSYICSLLKYSSFSIPRFATS